MISDAEWDNLKETDDKIPYRQGGVYLACEHTS